MFPPRERPTNLAIPGTFSLGNQPQSVKPTVVKLATGEKVHLISGKPARRHPRNYKPEVLHAIPSGRFVGTSEVVVQRERPVSYVGPDLETQLRSVLLDPPSGEAARNGKGKGPSVQKKTGMEVQKDKKSSPPNTDSITDIDQKEEDEFEPKESSLKISEAKKSISESERSVSEKSVSEKSVSEKSVSEKSVSEKSISEKSISEKSGSEKSISEKSISEKSASQLSSSHMSSSSQSLEISRSEPKISNVSHSNLLQDMGFGVFEDIDESLDIHSFLSQSESLLTSVGASDLVSPYAGTTFSPANQGQADTQLQMTLTLKEIMQSEHMYIRSLALLRNFFVEPLLVKCVGMQITCTPLLHMDTIIQALISKHDDFYSRMVQATSGSASGDSIQKLHRYASLAQTLFVGTSYGDYSAYAELILALVERQISPFESPYIKGLQKFLESNQPKARCMDLSVSSLLQKPMGRIAKYRLFLTSLQKLAPGDVVIEEALEVLNAGLSRINSEISACRQISAQTRELSPTLAAVPVEYFGIMRRHVQDVEASWLVAERRWSQFEVVTRAAVVVFFDHHLVILKRDQNATLFVIPGPNCIEVVDGEKGLCASKDYTTKVRFSSQHCIYELLLKADTSESHQVLENSLEVMGSRVYESFSDGDCYIETPIAYYDIEPGNPDTMKKCKNSCYFQKTHEVDGEVPVSRFKSISALRTRRLW